MADTDRLNAFVRDALAAGRSRDDIRAALTRAGWTAPEADTALAGWTDCTRSGPVPRPLRSRAAQDAVFYALLFIAFGVVAGNVLSLGIGQINIWLPDIGPSSGGPRALRWSMAALIVFAPVFWWLDRSDRRALARAPARRHGAVRRWLSSLALLVASVALLVDALVLIYAFLDGQMTARFAARAALIAALAAIVIAYFRQSARETARRPAGPALLALAVIALGLSLFSVGGPRRGQAEHRDRARISDLRELALDVAACTGHDALPDRLNPLDCARTPARLTALAAAVAYRRTDDTTFDLCVAVEAPGAISQYGIRITDDMACIKGTAR
ncbi:hypothetical protein AL036_06125 [Salipiger aestuarii]|uniref:DUF5671 domain-containing protein n=1 Tax=Salipiger aestuarii TaxID=568098 RepID=UPI00123BD0C3|nr:DUF5671 domain-containing protein [Salipiger aestuarii]KAA8608679.1 hypothetical protein AL036_06125 [Salipiger aestuarii]